LKVQKRNLHQIQTWITESGPSSFYFNISQLPNVLTAGRNGFLILGSENLITTTDVLVEILDFNGNSVFIQPIVNYQEGLSRLLSIEVYEDTPPGMARLTIVGEVAFDQDGQRPPDEWVGAYNVKWSTNVFINPSQNNTSKIRLKKFPSVNVTEILNPYRRVEGNFITIQSSGSVNISGVSPTAIPFIATKYIVQSDVPIFSQDMQGGNMTASIGTGSYESIIESVINDKHIIMGTPYKIGSTILPFETSIYNISFQERPIFLKTELTRSFANIELNDLQTLTGHIYQYDVKVRNVDSAENISTLATVVTEPRELLETSSVDFGDHRFHRGIFINQLMVDTFWTGSHISSGSYFGL